MLLSKATDICATYNVYTFSLMAHCTSGAIRGSVSCSRTLRQGIELVTFCLLNDFFTSCTTAAPTFHYATIFLRKQDPKTMKLCLGKVCGCVCLGMSSSRAVL